MADDDSLLKFFTEERQFCDVLRHYLDQVDDRPASNLEQPLPEVFSDNLFGYLTLVVSRTAQDKPKV